MMMKSTTCVWQPLIQVVMFFTNLNSKVITNCQITYRIILIINDINFDKIWNLVTEVIDVHTEGLTASNSVPLCCPSCSISTGQTNNSWSLYVDKFLESDGKGVRGGEGFGWFEAKVGSWNFKNVVLPINE